MYQNSTDPLGHIESNPLHWPSQVPRTENPSRSNFYQKKSDGWGSTKKTVATAIEELSNEVRLLGGKNLIISSNIATKKDGMPYSNAREPEDSGVAVYFTLDGAPACYPNDKWDRVADNIYGIAKIINAQRGISRWGTEENVRSTFQGFQMLPERGTGESWWEYFKVNPSHVTESEIAQAYKKRVKEAHPDRPGGSAAEFQKVQQLYSQALDAVRSKRARGSGS